MVKKTSLNVSLLSSLMKFLQHFQHQLDLRRLLSKRVLKEAERNILSHCKKNGSNFNEAAVPLAMGASLWDPGAGDRQAGLGAESWDAVLG